MGPLAVVGGGGGRSLFLMQRALTTVLHHRGIGVFLPSAWRLPLGPCRALEPSPSGFLGPAVPWSHQQARGKARGNEYQPSNLKRKHKHGWIKRIRSASGIEVILRRMLKGRKSLSH